MSNYSKTTDFEAKDSLPTGDSGKIIRGAEFETEFDAISTAIATKADTAGPTFTGTLTFETISDGTIGVTAFVDEDDMSSDSATLVPTQQSVKAYVDSQVTAQDLDFQADSGGALSIDLDSETMTFTGGTGIDTSGSGNDVEFAIDSTVATLTGSQTLINKTLTSPVLEGSVSGSAVLDEDNMSSNSATKLATQQSIKAYVDATVAATNELVEDSTPQLGGTLDLNGNNITGTGNINNTGTVTTDGLTVEGSSSTTLNNVNFLNTSTAYAATANRLGLGTTNSVGANYTYIEANNDVADGRPSLNLYTGSTATKRFRVTDGGDIEFYEDSGATAKLTWDASEEDLKFADNSKAIFGAGSDLQIYHDGTNSYIDDTSSGNLVLRGNPAVSIQKYTGEVSGVFNADGAVNLYYDNALKIATTSTGIDVTGVITTDGMTTSADINFGDNDKAVFGAGSDLQIYHNGSNSFVDDAGTGDLYIRSNRVFLGKYTGEVGLSVLADGAVNLNYDNAQKLATTSTGVDVTGTVTADGGTFAGATSIEYQNPLFTIKDTVVGGSGGIQFKQSTDAEVGRIATTDADLMRFYTGSAVTERMEISSAGVDVTGTVTADGLTVEGSNGNFEVATTGNSVNMTRAGNNFITASDLSGDLYLGAGGSSFLKIDNGGDISFYEDTGTTAKFFWDASAESLGIGTSSPAEQLHVFNAGNAVAEIEGGANADASLLLTETGSSGFSLKYDGTDNKLLIGGGTAGTFNTHMTVERDSGNVGIGTDSPAYVLDVESTGTNSENLARFSSSGGVRAVINTDGDDDGSLSLYDKNDAVQVLIRSVGGSYFNGGNVGIGTDSPSKKLHVKGTGSTAAMMLESSSSSNGQLVFKNTSTTNNFIVGLLGDTSGDALLYHGDAKNMQFWTNNTERMRIDSSGNVQIKSAGKLQAFRSDNARSILVYTDNDASTVESDTDPLKIKSADRIQFETGGANERMRIDSSGTVKLITANDTAGTEKFLTFGTNSFNRAGIKCTNAATYDGSLEFYTGNSSTFEERARLDKDGNLLVGTTDSAPAVSNSEVGVALSGSLGYVAASRSAGASGFFNRLSDGDIVNFNKDGSTVGSIGVLAGTSLSINAQGGVGVLQAYGTTEFNWTTDKIWPAIDNDKDLGDSNFRFKDLYLSGGVYLGGTGSANKLDDYEEGTWTPALSSTATAPTTSAFSITNATYTKVGRKVHIQAFIAATFSDLGSGIATITGLPFTPAGYSVAVFEHCDLLLCNGGYVNSGTARIVPITPNTTSGITYRDTGISRSMMISAEYETNA